MNTLNKKDNIRSKRYTSEEKNKIVAFVTDYNSTNGRGGQRAASQKFEVSQLTVSNWLKSAGVSGKATKSVAKGSMQSKLSTMLSLGQDIEKLQKELDGKRAKFEAIKASL